MRAILDNATITATFRALGLIETSSRELFDLDIAALRVFIDTVFLAKEIIILDNYKPEYSDERKNWLNHSSISFEPISQDLDKYLLKHAKAHVHNWQINRHLGTEFSEIFDELAILFRHAWRKSESFLVLKAFGVENKYQSALIEELMKQLPKAIDNQELNKFSPKSYNRETERGWTIHFLGSYKISLL